MAVKGMVGSSIANIQELGLSDIPIRITPTFAHMDVNANAWGQAPFEVQFMLAWVNISMQLVHFDRDVLDICLRESMGGSASEGQITRAGTRLGGGVVRFAPGNHLMGLNITSTVAGRPWRFFFSYLTGPPIEIPLGNERSLVVCNWRAIPYTTDPYGAGLGAAGAYIWDHQLDG